MRNKTREEIVKEVEERIKTRVKELLESLIGEERGDLPGKPSCEGQRLLGPRPPHLSGASGRPLRFGWDFSFRPSRENAVYEAPKKTREKDQEALAEDLKKIFWAESREEAEEALRSWRERWGGIYPKSAEIQVGSDHASRTQ